MTRKSERELERAVDELGGDDPDGGPMTVRIRHTRVDERGEPVETIAEEVVDLDRDGPGEADVSMNGESGP